MHFINRKAKLHAAPGSAEHMGSKKHAKRPPARRLIWKAFKHFLALAAMVVLFGLCSEARAAETDQWSFDLAPYLWVARLDVETSLSGSASSGNSSERFDTRISAGAMLSAQVHYRAVGMFADFAWLQLNTDAIDPGPAYSSINLKSDFIHATAALSYRLPLEGKFQAEALAGARIWYVGTDLDAGKGVLPGFNASNDTTWADPVVGANFNYELSRRWSLGLRGFVGGFGVSAELAGEVFAGATYHFTDWCSATLGYRYLYEKYDRSLKLELDAQGFLLGFGFHF